VPTAAPAADLLFVPSTHVLWSSAPFSFPLPVSLPPGATSATLSVEADGYSRTYAGLAGGSFRLELPAADSPKIYRLTLAFDDWRETVETARLVVSRGAAFAGAADADVKTAGSRAWPVIGRRQVLPVPEGVTEIRVDGQPVEAACWTSPGWFDFSGPSGRFYDLELMGEADTLLAEATVRSPQNSFSICIK
jgi:hypothetical protein